jgi:hypothetical protein
MTMRSTPPADAQDRFERGEIPVDVVERGDGMATSVFAMTDSVSYRLWSR